MTNADQNCCLSFREDDWVPPLYGPLLFHTHGQGDLAFGMALMKGMYMHICISCKEMLVT